MVLKFKDTRIAFVAILLSVAIPRAAQSQQAEKVYRIGYLSLPPLDARLDSFRKGLRDLGYSAPLNRTVHCSGESELMMSNPCADARLGSHRLVDAWFLAEGSGGGWIQARPLQR
jgi:hypothetical protein